jgi:hypothetical protein
LKFRFSFVDCPCFSLDQGIRHLVGYSSGYFFAKLHRTAGDLRVGEVESKSVQLRKPQEEQEIQKLVDDLHGTIEKAFKSGRIWSVHDQLGNLFEHHQHGIFVVHCDESC